MGQVYEVDESGSITKASGLTVDAGTIKVDAATHRVGIKTLTPGYDLDVNGTARIGTLAGPLHSTAGVVSALNLTSGGILYGNGTGALQATAVLANGQLLIGDGSGVPTIATLSGTTNQVSVANGAGSITLSLPQSIHSGASPTFAGMTLSGLTGVAKANGASAMTAGTVSLATEVNGVLPVARGGTNKSTIASGKLLYTTATDVFSEGTITSAGLAILDDTDSAAQRVTLGLAIGTNVQAYNDALQSISGLVTAADRMIYTTAANTYAVGTLTTAGRAILDDADVSAQRSTLGLGSMATQNSGTVSISGGTVSGITDLAVADGGTGASTAATGLNNLLPTQTGNNGKSLVTDGANVSWQASGVPTNVPTWIKFTKTYSNLSAALETYDIELYSLPAGGIVHGVKIKHTQTFNVTGYSVGVGIAGNLTKYASYYLATGAIAGDKFQLSQGFFSENNGAVTSIRLAATVPGGTTSMASSGSVDVWLLVSTAV
jgi:hypothetical protein